MEWTEGFETQYQQVVRLAGSGDKGRDVVGYLGDPTDPTTAWDNYQCKHYDHPLRPSDIWIELGKLCAYTHRGDYSLPRQYRFVAPRGVGTKLHDLLRKPEDLKTQLIERWNTDCKEKISNDEPFPLEGPLRRHVETFNFQIVWFLTPQEVLNQHQKTKYWHRRFKIDPLDRPSVASPPNTVQPHELLYTTLLLSAYCDHLKVPPIGHGDLGKFPKLLAHFRRSRGYFFSAEALARFSRDHFAPGAFDAIKQHVADTVIDVAECDYPDGYRRVLATTTAAAAIQLPQNDLVPYVSPADKKGICHHLVNDGQLYWIQS